MGAHVDKRKERFIPGVVLLQVSTTEVIGIGEIWWEFKLIYAYKLKFSLGSIFSQRDRSLVPKEKEIGVFFML